MEIDIDDDGMLSFPEFYVGLHNYLAADQVQHYEFLDFMRFLSVPEPRPFSFCARARERESERERRSLYLTFRLGMLPISKEAPPASILGRVWYGVSSRTGLAVG